RFEEMQQQLRVAQIYARENARLERGLLPLPLLADARLTVATRYRPGGGQMLLGGDFFDLVEGADGWVHVVVGDVCGHGPEEAGRGVCLRVGGRRVVLAGRPMAEVLSAVQQVLEHERHEDRLFATLCMVSVAPDRAHARLHLAGHPPPLLLAPGGVTELRAPVSAPPGIAHVEDWPVSEVDLGDSWTLLLYTDGLIEGRGGTGQRRADGDDREVPARHALRWGAGAQAARRAPAGCPGRPGARPQRRGPGRRPGRARPRISRCGREMTDAPRDAAGAAPEFDGIRPDTAAGTSGQGPDTGNPADRSPRGGAAAGPARPPGAAARPPRPGAAPPG